VTYVASLAIARVLELLQARAIEQGAAEEMQSPADAPERLVHSHALAHRQAPSSEPDFHPDRIPDPAGRVHADRERIPLRVACEVDEYIPDGLPRSGYQHFDAYGRGRSHACTVTHAREIRLGERD
jgi:hypothetical protein